MRRTVSAYTDKARTQKMADLPGHELRDGWQLPDERLIELARTAMVERRMLTSEEAASAFMAIEEGG